MYNLLVLDFLARSATHMLEGRANLRGKVKTAEKAISV
jgi:hypothetical protein